MKTTNFLLCVISILLLWIAVNLTPTATAEKRWDDVNIAAVGGNPIYGDAIPTK